ncbi:hypothetical protein [Clostridium pasteurianum]|uniref:Helix-turn-helix protein n=1 Tax=Clostridium pasteurianum BC1 TaxID=86416 RepID=R4K208_CLOPA|nr:hypothetical protein [Clostridium pasteurianum]AGK97132.1 hypothetical protein Clopa_2262 [Clostridium pasteurianum BC1]
MNDELSFGKFISDKRKAQGVTLRGMADLVGISNLEISVFANGS